ncbi:hypothetical protein FQA39_LY10972 [Lamprigera yunnana]|nr:hypothetical protein FQA39_LY10972 [Lamprigera yunnana]
MLFMRFPGNAPNVNAMAHVNQIVKREVPNTIVTEVDTTGSPSCNSQDNGIPEIPVINKNFGNTDIRTAESESLVEANSDQDANPKPDVNIAVTESQRTVAPLKRFEDFVMSK